MLGIDQPVVGPEHQVLGVLALPRMAVELEGAARGQPARRAAGQHPHVRRLQLLAPDRRHGVAERDVLVRPGLAIDLAPEELRHRRGLGLGEERQARLLEIVVRVHVGRRAQPARDQPSREEVAVAARRVVLEVERHHLVALGRLELGDRVGQDEGVAALVVLEEIEDALVLEQALHEVEVALVVLHAVFPRGVALLQPLLELGLGILAEDLLDDLDHAEVLEDAAIVCQPEQPQPGAQHHLVARDPLLDLDDPELAHEPVEPALGIARLGLDRQRPVDERVRLHVELGTGQADGELEAAADLVEARQMGERQRLTLGRLDCRGAILGH